MSDQRDPSLHLPRQNLLNKQRHYIQHIFPRDTNKSHQIQLFPSSHSPSTCSTIFTRYASSPWYTTHYQHCLSSTCLNQHHPLHAGHDFLSLCYAPDLPPCIVIRRILESIPALSLRNPKRITELLRHPDKIRNLISIEKVQEALQQEGCPFALQDATAFLDKLTEDIYTAVQCDLIYSPTADVERHKAGLEHEAKLYSALESMDISYLSEDLLRSKGFYKTPDARLQVPIAVSGKVVCWVDSKATFGDERTHRFVTICIIVIVFCLIYYFLNLGCC